MQRTTILGKTVEQTTGSSTMLRIVFQDLPRSNGFKNLIKHDALFSHFLLSMLGDANVLHVSLSTYPLQHDF